MTETLTSDINNDFEIFAGDFKTCSGKKAYAEIIRHAVLTRKGELQLNVLDGIPYFETVFDSPNYINLWKNAVRNTINGFSFVKNIISFNHSVDYSNHILHFDITIATDDGTVAISQ